MDECIRNVYTLMLAGKIFPSFFSSAAEMIQNLGKDEVIQPIAASEWLVKKCIHESQNQMHI